MVGTEAFVKKWDMFAESVPQFKLRGNSVVRTCIGGSFSLAIIYCTLLFALHKCTHLIERKSPLITTNREKNAIGASETLATYDGDFMMAFALRHFDGVQSLSDPRYVKWVGRVWTVTETGNSYEYYALHKCTEQDLSKFYSIENPA